MTAVRSVVHGILRRMAAGAARASLAATFSPEAIDEIVGETVNEYERSRENLPNEDGMGGKLMLHLAALTVAFYRVLVSRGLGAEEARRQTAEATWFVYERMARIPRALSAWRRDPHKRLKGATGVFRRFPFGRPSYQMVDVSAEKGTVAFDVLRCPVAEYFSAQGLSELCQKSFCDLDFPLADRWGAALERSGTLASGASRCDFRWRVVHRSPGQGPKGGT